MDTDLTVSWALPSADWSSGTHPEPQSNTEAT